MSRASHPHPFYVNAVEPGKITINENIHTTSVVLNAQTCFTDWIPESFLELTLDHLLRCLTLKPRTLILGTGTTHHILPSEWYLPFHQEHIGLEVMQSRWAANAYNVLVSENRDVTAVILLR